MPMAPSDPAAQPPHPPSPPPPPPPSAKSTSTLYSSVDPKPVQPKHSRRARRRNGGGPPQLQFLTATDPSQFKDEKSKRSVRSQAMIQYRYNASEKRRKHNQSSTNDHTLAESISMVPKGPGHPPSTAPPWSHPPLPTETSRSQPWWEEDEDYEPYNTTLEAWRSRSPSDPVPIAAFDDTSQSTALRLPFRPHRYCEARNAIASSSHTTANPVLDYDRSPEHDQKLFDIALNVACVGNGVDPFLVLPRFASLELDSFKLVRMCNRTFSTASTLEKWLPAMLSHPHILLSSTIVASTWMDMHAGVRGESRRTVVVKGEILSWIKERLNTADLRTHDSTIIVIVHMLAGEMWNCNEQTLRWHEMGVAKLIAHRGGMDLYAAQGPVGVTSACVCYHNDIICEVVPLAEFADWEPPPVPEGSEDALPESPLFYRTAEMIPVLNDPQCSMHTYEILCDMRDLTDLFISHNAGIHAGLDFEVKRHPSAHSHTASNTAEYDRRVDEIRTKLAMLPSAFVSNLPTSGDFVYEACRLVALIYTSAIITRVPFSVAAEPARNVVLLDPTSVQPPEVFTKRLTQSLYEILERTNIGDLWGDMAGVFYWVTAVGAAAARTSVTTNMYHDPSSLSEEYATWIRRCLIMFSTRALIVLMFRHSIPIVATEKRLLKVQELLGSGRLRKSV